MMPELGTLFIYEVDCAMGDVCRIGVTRWEDVPGEAVDRYWSRIVEAGAEVVDLSEEAADRVAEIAPTLDALMLTGGIDVDPLGQPPQGFQRGLLVARVAAIKIEEHRPVSRIGGRQFDGFLEFGLRPFAQRGRVGAAVASQSQ